MRFPIIRVKDKETGFIHIIGINSHDSLEIDNETGVLKYYNMQNGCGTGSQCSYEFSHPLQSPKEIKYGITPTIEFVTFEQLTEIYQEAAQKEQKQADLFNKLNFEKITKLKGKDREPDDDDDF